jgi:hypothetical protein
MKLDDWFPKFGFTWAKYSSWEYLLEVYLNKDICVLDESIYCLKGHLVVFNIDFKSIYTQRLVLRLLDLNRTILGIR